MAIYKDIEPINKKALATITTDDLYGMGMQAGIELVLEIINTQPTADVEEVRHGEWIEGKTLEKCSVCGKKGFPDWHYCPKCGAKMDGGN